jgi:hypothetical protein
VDYRSAIEIISFLHENGFENLGILLNQKSDEAEDSRLDFIGGRRFM